ncbi:MAG TPA: molybdenum cofactor guanylyltransferase [Ktedonobacterales bacterium]|nr:molybdenum cofactor guanylyltransferase [Ktedonobacterales bacterium]
MKIEDGGPEQFPVTGVVLAGGASARMGRSKAVLELRGEPLLRRVVRRLRLALPNVLVVGPPDLATLVPDATVLPDLTPGAGPLGGLHTALRAVTTPWAFVVACDMPFVAPALVRAMARLATAHGAADVVALRTTHGVEPLHAVYHTSCLAAVERRIATADHSMAGLLSTLTVHVVEPAEVAPYDPSGRSAFNANTPAEWQQALALAATEDPR